MEHPQLCPRCARKLDRLPFEAGVYYACTQCRGKFVGVGVLRKLVQAPYVDGIWRAAVQLAPSQSRNCPSCTRPMSVVYFSHEGIRTELDVCKICYMVWFDPGELEDLPANPSYKRKPEPSPLEKETAQKLAAAMAESMARSNDDAPYFHLSELPGWAFVPALLGLPVKIDEGSFTARPWMTWTLIAVFTWIAIQTRTVPLFQDYGFNPTDPLRKLGLTWITYSFLHAGYLHLIFNSYFLLLFGPEVESALGIGRFVKLFVLAAVGGCAAILVLTPHDSRPTVGASAAIFGVLTYFTLLFPRFRLGISLGRFRLTPVLLKIPVYGYFLFILLTQLLGALMQWFHASNISFIGHLGGMIAGALTWAWDTRALRISAAQRQGRLP